MHRTPPDTAKRHKGKKPAFGTSSISRTPQTSSDTELEEQQHEFESPLGEFVDQTPRAHKPAHQTPIMAEDTAQAEIRRLRAQLTQAETTILDLSQSANPDEDRDRLSEIELQQQENREARQHELEMAKLQLQIEQAKAANSTPAAIQITQREDKVASFKKEVAAKSLKTSFKLEGSTNYESWRDEALTQALAIKAKHILINKEMACPAGITDDDERKIWEVKSEALFDMLLAGAKPAIRQTIKAKIDEDEKNAAELWTAIETEFRIHAADTRMELLHRFATATIEDNNNVQQYISQFRDICSRLKHMGFEVPLWLQTDRFIDGLKGHQAAFVQAKRDDSKDPKNKGKITELDLKELMDQLIARAVDHKDRQRPAQALKAEDKPNETSESTPRQGGSSPSRQSSTRGSGRDRGGHHHQDNKRCGYCNSPFHDESKCRLKNHTNQSEEWQTINASAIQYYKKKNEDRTTDLKPAAGSTPTTPATPSTPTPMANPNVGYSAMTLSAINPVQPIPKAVGANFHIPNIWDIPEAVGAINKEETTELPRPKRGRLKQQSLVDPAVLSARKLTNWQIEPDIDGTGRLEGY
jgi:hypothetical protein